MEAVIPAMPLRTLTRDEGRQSAAASRWLPLRRRCDRVAPRELVSPWCGAEASSRRLHLSSSDDATIRA
jgi:hypothetical protein